MVASLMNDISETYAKEALESIEAISHLEEFDIGLSIEDVSDFVKRLPTLTVAYTSAADQHMKSSSSMDAAEFEAKYCFAYILEALGKLVANGIATDLQWELLVDELGETICSVAERYPTQGERRTAIIEDVQNKYPLAFGLFNNGLGKMRERASGIIDFWCKTAIVYVKVMEGLVSGEEKQNEPE
jgi:hypothetical protein